MGISYKGHSLDWQFWVFDIDGRDWVAINQSTPNPLNIQFEGRYRKWGDIPLSKGGGFDILSSTTTATSDIGEKRGVVEWVWSGSRYKSSWAMFAGQEVVAADREEGIPAEWDYQLKFIGRIPYDGPSGGSVGTGVVSQATVSAKTKEDREAAEAAAAPQPATMQITPAAQLSTVAPEQASPAPARPVSSGVASPAVIQAQQTNKSKEDREAAEASMQITPAAQLSTAAPEIQYPMPATSGPVITGNAVNTAVVNSGIASPAVIQAQQANKSKEDREAAEAAPYGGPSGSGYVEPPVAKPVSTGVASPAVIKALQTGKSKEDLEASTAYKNPVYTQPAPALRAPAPTPPTPVGIVTSPVIIPGTKDAREAAEAAAAAAPAVDWPGLLLKLGAAYLLIS